MSIFVVNLLPWRQRRVVRRTRYWSLLLLLHAGGLLLALTLGKNAVIRQRTEQEAVLVRAQQQQLQQRTQLHAVQQMMAQLQRHQRRKLAEAAVRGDNARYLHLMEQLATLVPAGLWLTELTYNGSRMNISGVSHGYEDIVQFRTRLENQSVLRAVQIIQARQESIPSADGQKSTVLVFQLQAEWRDKPHGALGVLSND